jgi:hypothetical protein
MKNKFLFIAAVVMAPLLSLLQTSCTTAVVPAASTGYVTPGYAYYGASGYYPAAYGVGVVGYRGYGGDYGTGTNVYANSRGGYAVSNGYAGYAQSGRGGSASWAGDSGSASGYRGGSASWNNGSGSASGARGGSASWGGGSGSYQGAGGRSGSWGGGGGVQRSGGGGFRGGGGRR